MKRVEGYSDIRLLECTNPVKNKWRLRFDVVAGEDGACSYMEEELDHKPDSEEIRSIVSQWYNSETDKKILSGLEYEGHTVWLSNENQFNYKAAYDIAVQTSGQNLPVTFKLAYIIHSGFISGYQNRYGDNLKPPTNVYHRMTA